MPTAPTPITPYATPPNSNDPLNFDARADAKVAADVVFVTEANALAANVYANALEADADATAADASATDAAASAAAAAASEGQAAAAIGAPVWSALTVYQIGDPAYSTISTLIYRRKGSAGSGGADPSANPTNWVPAASNGLQQVLVSGTSATVSANTDTCFTNVAAWAATLPAIALGESVVIRGDNGLLVNTVDLGARSMVGPNGVIRSGVITLNVEPKLSLRWWGDYYRSN